MWNEPYQAIVNDHPGAIRRHRRHRHTMKHARLFGLSVTGFLHDGRWRVYYQCWVTGKLTYYTFETFKDGLACILDNMQFIPN